jgi:hypothetical protein
MQWGSKESDIVVWKILKESDFFSHDDDPLILPDSVEFRKYPCKGKEAELNKPTDYFFKYIFPDITGKYKLSADCHVNSALSLLLFFPPFKSC